MLTEEKSVPTGNSPRTAPRQGDEVSILDVESAVRDAADERVFRSIYDLVQAQRVAPGTKLKEVELAQHFKVSRNSVRTALLRLSHKGLVTLVPNRGAVIAKPSRDECRDVLQARCAVELAVVDHLARCATPEIARRLRAQVDAQREAFDCGDSATGHRLAIDFHRLLAQLAGNRLLARFLDDLLAMMPLVILAIGTPQPVGEAASADHAALVEAIAQRDALLASRLMAEHLAHLQEALDRAPPPPSSRFADVFGIRP
jgi:DNA-binding GntR family transcriptional regulator